MGRWAYMSSTDSDGDHTNMEWKFWFGTQSSLSWEKFNCGELTVRVMFNGEEFDADETTLKKDIMLGSAITDWINTRDDVSDCGHCENIMCGHDMSELMCNEIDGFRDWVSTDGNDLEDIFDFNEDMPEILYDYNNEMDMNHLKQAFTHGNIGEINSPLPKHSLYLLNKYKVNTWDDIDAMVQQACNDWDEYVEVVEPLAWGSKWMKDAFMLDDENPRQKIHRQEQEDFSNALLARMIWEQLNLSKAEVNIVFEY